MEEARLFFPYLRRGHQFDNVSKEVQERRGWHLIKLDQFFLHVTNV
jgi:hypothetical protein